MIVETYKSQHLSNHNEFKILTKVLVEYWWSIKVQAQKSEKKITLILIPSLISMEFRIIVQSEQKNHKCVILQLWRIKQNIKGEIDHSLVTYYLSNVIFFIIFYYFYYFFFYNNRCPGQRSVDTRTSAISRGTRNTILARVPR